MDKLHKIQFISFQTDKMIVEIDNQKYLIDLKNVSRRLLNATDAERSNFEITHSNYGIHWPLIDEDLSIHNLIKSSELV